jgi:hypothetical protein
MPLAEYPKQEVSRRGDYERDADSKHRICKDRPTRTRPLTTGTTRRRTKRGWKTRWHGCHYSGACSSRLTVSPAIRRIPIALHSS